MGTIVHIRVVGLAFKSPTAPGGATDVISHVPYQEKALAESVTVLDKENVLSSGWEEGYELWKTAFDAGEAGIWTIPVSDAISATEETVAGRSQ